MAQNRFNTYENSYDHFIISRIPVIIKIDGWSFSKVTSDINKPFCHKTMAIFGKTMMSLIKEIEGVVFGYCYSDKIILVLKNDKSFETEPWFGNKVQRLSSVSASLASYYFMQHLWEMADAPKLNHQIAFKSNVFAVPDINEVINYLIYRQRLCNKFAVNKALYTLLSDKYGDKLFSILNDKSINERIDIINQHGANFDTYPKAYTNGFSSFYVTKLVSNESSGSQFPRNDLFINFNQGLFSEEKSTLKTILQTGKDIFRPERDL